MDMNNLIKKQDQPKEVEEEKKAVIEDHVDEGAEIEKEEANLSAF